MNNPTQKKNKTLDYIIYGIAIFIVIFLCWALGTSMDYCIKYHGKLDMNYIGDSFSVVVSKPNLLILSLQKQNSYAPKMIFMGVCVIGIFLLYKFSEEKKRLHRKGVEHGSAKWGDKKEMSELKDKSNKTEVQLLKTKDGKRVFDENGNFAKAVIDNNIILTEEVFLSLNAHQHLLNLNVLIIGGSGAGKTRFFAKPNIMQLNTSYVITDPKGEILQSTGKMLEQAGYKVRVFNTIEMQHSNNYNPFEYVYDINGNLSEDNVVKMVDTLFKNTKGDGEKDDFWSQKGQTLLEAITFLLFEESEYNAKFDENGKIIPETRDKTHLNFFSLTEKMRKLLYPPKMSQVPDGFFLERMDGETEEDFRQRQQAGFLCPLDKDFIELEKRKGETLAMQLYKEVRNAPEETGQSFLSSANVKTFMFNLTNVKNLTCCDNIHLETIGDEKTALFIIISATNTTYNFLAAMMYTQMFDVLANRANFKYGGVLPVHVRCIMDEFANIGQIPDFDKVIAFVRSMGMSLNVILQNMAQIKAKYEKTWEVIVGNCDSLLFLGGKEGSTLKYISSEEVLGKETIDVTGYNKTKGAKNSQSTAENNSILGRELMQPNEIATMPISDCILVIRSHNPFYCKKYPIENHPNYKLLGDYNKDNAFDVNSVHVITFEEILKEKKVDTNINFSENQEKQAKITETEKTLDKIFENKSKEITISAEEINVEDFEDIDTFGNQLVGEFFAEDIQENFAEGSPKFGKVSSLQTFDLGEPLKEVNDNELSDDVSVKVPVGGNDEVTEKIQYSTEKVDEVECDVSDENLNTAILDTNENLGMDFEEMLYDDEYDFE